jgi:ATP:ADP antiporter, AAA family
MMHMVIQMLKSWFGNFSREELKKFCLLGLIFAVMIGINWLLRTLKDSAFITMTGYQFIPHAKALSFIISVPLVALYGKLVDRVSRYKLFYMLCVFYTISTCVFAYFLMHTHYGVANTLCSPWRMIGWSWYVFVESFGSLLVTLFWAFVADITAPESARRGYSIIALGGQLGNIAGPYLVEQYAEQWGTGLLAAVGAVGIFFLIPLMYLFTRVISAAQLAGFHGVNARELERADKKIDFAEGFGLLISKPYLLGIFGIVCFYEIIYALFDYRFKALAGIIYQGEALTKYFAQFGMTTGIVAFFCLLAGINNIGRWLGLTVSLIVSPLVMGILTVLHVSQDIAVIMWVIVIANVINYALHQPTKEQLYIPTTHEAKYKTKAWIEIFGLRGAKALGSGINISTLWFGSSFLLLSSGISGILVVIWFGIALRLGRTYTRAVTENKLIS